MYAKQKATRETLTADNILNSPRYDKRSSTGLRQPRQDLLIREEVHNQMVRLRDAFLREDPRISGVIPRHLMACTFKAGGMELLPQQIADAKYQYTNGDGQFNWMRCCDDIEKARKGAWTEAARLKHAVMFKSIDADGSGGLGKAELRQAVAKMGIKVAGKDLDDLFKSFDEDNDNNLDFAEFVDGLATNMVTPSPVWSRVANSGNGPKKLGNLKLRPITGKPVSGSSPRGAGAPASPRGSGLQTPRRPGLPQAPSDAWSDSIAARRYMNGRPGSARF